MQTTQILFGTDGVRGPANSGPMAPDCILKLATAAAHHGMKKYFASHGDHRFTIVIGKDTRLSGYMVESSLVAGFVSMGADVILLGPLPTPAVAMLTRSLRAQMGVMISASHNPFQDNGIKFFGPDGCKINRSDEETIEQLTTGKIPLANCLKIGRAKRLDDAAGRYIEFAKATFPRGQRLDGLKIVVDCAHGATYKVAPKVLWELGADVIPVGIEPNGENINLDCGATSPALLQQTVLSHQADLGIALDGDGDRLLMVDEHGHILDGDQLLGLIATLWLEIGLLRGNGIVGTVMSNLGLESYLHSKGLTLHRSSVGDRFVLEKMCTEDCNVGGEQSGHIILKDYVTTGDGLIAALQVLSLLKNTGQRISEIAHVFQPVPQILKNIRTTYPINLQSKSIQQAISYAEKQLHPHGRLLVRPSGTEPLLRIMAQGNDKPLLDKVIEDLIAAIQPVEKVA
ncbi:phosphoglucosamine mutase [Candidatus Finniella inopinata]|uniref:Phosphoglucosamine mutase n=2 Tax=Candidatus Finniella inopinata TaxID=1696036 RepID=A0A4Q7DH59_9PROT|nr:phosphoglucosamine mutase [Candidatus Finniella inopinata]